MEDNTSVEVLSAAKETLLRGLSEENQGLQSVPSISYKFYFFIRNLQFQYIHCVIFFFQTLCPELLESGKAPPYCDPGANDGCAAFTVHQ